ncbi:MAG: Crp/Fnr family transcriptional regulator [Bacteriovoracia bacterium]
MDFLWTNLFSKKDAKEVTVIETLKANQLFLELSPKELKYVAKMVHLREYQPGEVIFSQYEKGLGMYMLAKGKVEIRSHKPYSPKKEVLITTLEAGSFFGEIALVDQENKRTASAYAVGPTILVGFFKPDLMEIMVRKPETGIKIVFALASVLGRRLNETTETLTSLHTTEQARGNAS